MKACTKCKQVKTLEDFAIKTGRKDGRCSICKECKRNWNHKEYINNRDRERKRLKVQKEKRIRAFEEICAKVKVKCNRCPENRLPTLVFHHINPAEKDFTVAQARRRYISEERILKEIAKCEVLCANCHMMEHFSEEDREIV